WLHETGPHHPERPARLDAFRHGIEQADLAEAVTWIEAPPADRAAVERIHPGEVLDRLQMLCMQGGGPIDPDTIVNEVSSDAAWVAAGAGLELIRRLDRGEADAGWSVVRPPGHHALPNKQMGFCLINNVAVAARFLADRGERVAVVDIDAHHGNGTQDIFYDDPDVLFVSLHQYPWYPYTGAVDEIGAGAGVGATVNIPLPASTAGSVYRTALEEIVIPRLERFAPTWMLISAGFDGHRADPITDLGLSSGDYADAADLLMKIMPAGRRLLFLEGGYDTDALAACAGSVAAAAVDHDYRPERPTDGERGASEVAAAKVVHLRTHE
ncbi:MAG: histone deacetylase, partial [Acidimicrobiales bacterium]|nr:histone deacetylase [Acidimicrobiales bacterium]